jgi:hypothetical protein
LGTVAVPVLEGTLLFSTEREGLLPFTDRGQKRTSGDKRSLPTSLPSIPQPRGEREVVPDVVREASWTRGGSRRSTRTTSTRSQLLAMGKQGGPGPRRAEPRGGSWSELEGSLRTRPAGPPGPSLAGHQGATIAVGRHDPRGATGERSGWRSWAGRPSGMPALTTYHRGTGPRLLKLVDQLPSDRQNGQRVAPGPAVVLVRRTLPGRAPRNLSPHALGNTRS